MNKVALNEVRDAAFVDLQGQKNGAVVDLHLLTFDGDPLASLEVGAPQQARSWPAAAMGKAPLLPQEFFVDELGGRWPLFGGGGKVDGHGFDRLGRLNAGRCFGGRVQRDLGARAGG
jgi:hypothetical protein